MRLQIQNLAQTRPRLPTTQTRTLIYSKKVHPAQGQNTEKILISDLVTQTNTQNDSVDNTTHHEIPSKAQITIDITTVVFRINKRITTPVTLEIRPSNGASNLDVAPTRRNIFMVLKLIEPTVKLFTPGNATKDLLDMFPSEASKYTSMC